MKRLTLEEVGKLSGVSRSTVSRVINDHPNIRPEIRERVKKVIAETGYQPNSAARSLASNQSKILGLIIPSIIQSAFTDPYYPHLIQGISHTCNQNDYTVSLFLFQTQQEEQKMIKRMVNSGLIDGLIITADTIDHPFVPTIQQYNISFVQIGRPREEDAHSISYVDVDNVTGAYLATVHLIRSGYRRIAQIATVHNTAGMDRDAGYRKALIEHGFDVDEDLIEVADFSEAGGCAAMEILLRQKPDAVFAQSDAVATGAMRAIRSHGLEIPRDIAIVGFDDLPIAERTDPPLTTVHQPIYETGVFAAETLIDMIHTPTTTPQHVVLPVELVIRASSGAVN